MIVANKNKVVEMANNLSESDSGVGRSIGEMPVHGLFITRQQL